MEFERPSDGVMGVYTFEARTVVIRYIVTKHARSLEAYRDVFKSSHKSSSIVLPCFYGVFPMIEVVLAHAQGRRL
jgi:hypothetical protein